MATQTSNRISISSTERDLPESDKDFEVDSNVTLPQGTSDPEKPNSNPDVSIPVSDWRGPDDPENPLNWSSFVKSVHLVTPGLMAFSATLGTSIYTPAYGQVMERFNVGSTVALLPLSLYVLALGLGPVLGAPLSETYGRHIVYLVSAPLAALFTLGAGFSPNFASLAILRFFAGMFFSPCLAIGAGTIADIKPAHERAPATAMYILSPFLGPSLGPVIGSFVSVRKGWQWTQWTLIFFAIFSWLFCLVTRETYKKTIIARRNKRLGLPPPPSPFPSEGAKLRFMLTVTLFRPLHMLFTESIVGFLSLYIAFNFAVLYTFFAAFPLVFGETYGFTTEQSGLVFLGIGIGCLIAIPTVLLFDHHMYQHHYRVSHAEGRNGIVAPEHRLYPAMIGSFGLPIALFWFAWTARSSIHWICPIIASIPFAWGNLTIFISSGMYLVDTYGAMNGASALAANGLLRYSGAAAFPLFTLQMYRGMGTAWATSLLGFVTILLMPIPWVLFKYGSKIRSKSNYDTIKA